jgi:hypothetical protein
VGFLTLNGLEVQVRSARQENVIPEAMSRTIAGSFTRDRRFVKRKWTFETIRNKEITAAALRAMLEGRGYTFPFDADLYSAQNLSPGSTVGTLRPAVAADGAAVVDANNVSESRFGSSALTVEPGRTNILSANQSSVETNTTGFVAMDGATLTRVTAQRMFGSASLQVVTSAAVNGQAGGVTITAACNPGNDHAASFYARAASAVTIRANLDDDWGTIGGAVTVTLNAGKWTRIEVPTLAVDGSATTVTLTIRENTVDSGITFQIDGLQIEVGTTPTSWVLGGTARAAGNLGYPVAPFLFDSRDLTVNFWARCPSANPTSAQTFFMMREARSGASTYNRFEIQRQSGNNDILFVTYDDFGTGTQTVYSTNPWDGAWHLVTAVMRRSPESGESKMTLYFDGVQVGTAAPTNLPLLSRISTQVDIGQAFGTSRRIGDNGAPSLMDDLMILPFAAPAEMIVNWAARVAAYPSFPVLEASGDFILESTLNVRGRVTEGSFKRIVDGSTWRPNTRELTFELEEV